MFPPSRTTTLLLLLALAALQQVRFVRTAVLPAQDVVDVVSVAQRIERDGLAATVRAEPVPPLFPALVAIAHTVTVSAGWIDAHNWVAPPQWVAAAALIAAVIPIYLCVERLAGSTAAVIAAIAFVVLPSTARLGADGLPDALHLALMAWSVWFTLVALETGARWRWLAAGAAVAAALLCRAEAAVLPMAILCWSVLRTEYRVPSYFAGVGLCVAAFLLCGVTRSEDIVERLRGSAAPTEDVPLNAESSTPAVAPSRRLETTLEFGHKDRARSTRVRSILGCLKEFADEFVQAFGYVLPPVAFVGVAARRRLGFAAFDRLVLAAVGLHLAIVCAMTLRNGYLSTRHFMVPIVLLLPYLGVGVAHVCRRLADSPWNRWHWSSRSLQAAMIATFAVGSLAVTSPPLHGAHAAHRDVAAWLQQPEAAAGVVLDQRGWTGLFSGRTTYRFDAAETALDHPHLAYVLVERADLEAETRRGRSLRAVLGRSDQAVAVFPAARSDTARDVLVFRQTTIPLAAFEIAERESTHAR
jgi:hypothetical protein